MTSQSKPTAAVPLDAIREELNKVLSSEVFQASERSRTLLRFVVEETSSGRADGLKEYTLGADALGKGPAFDPRTDPVVRSEVSRLRARLDKYYATEGQSDSLVIALPKGSYVPRFEHRMIASGGPAGARAERRRSAFRGRAALAIAASAFVAAITLISYLDLAPLNSPSGVEAERAVAATNATAISIAVLPFVNLSGDPSQDFFSDGITEEITSALARVPGLMVLARTSAFEFKGQNRDVRSIGEALGARYLIEGSVRKDGDRVRISAQLVEAVNGAHVWSQSYDRQLVDVFGTQEDIAQAIAASLRIPLSLTLGQNLVTLRPKDQETYELFLRGRAAWRARRIEEAVQLLEQVVARDPNFAPGWRFLASARNGYNILRYIKGEEPKTYPESQETLARRVIALAPDSADGYAMLATLADGEGQRLEALQMREQALQRDPNDPEVMNGYANDLWELGYLKQALEVRERQHLLEPLVPIFNLLRAETLAANGMLEEALRDWLAVRPNRTAGAWRLVAPAYAQLGRFDEAIDALVQAGLQHGLGASERTQAEIDAAVQVLRAAANKTAALLPDFDVNLGPLHAYTNTPERMLDWLEKDFRAGTLPLRVVWWPTPSSLRKTERFKTLMRDAGFVDIWRVRGWPDLCRPIGADDFECA